MAQYNRFNVKLSTSQLIKLYLGLKNGTEVTLKISSNVVGDSNDKNNFLLSYNYLIRKFQSFV